MEGTMLFQSPFPRLTVGRGDDSHSPLPRRHGLLHDVELTCLRIHIDMTRFSVLIDDLDFVDDLPIILPHVHLDRFPRY